MFKQSVKELFEESYITYLEKISKKICENSAARERFKKVLQDIKQSGQVDFRDWQEVRQFLEKTYREIQNDNNRNIFRDSEIPQHTYTLVQMSTKLYENTNLCNLTCAYTDFCKQFYERLVKLDRTTNQGRIEDISRDEYLLRTTAWLHYRINFTDHFFKDGCSRVAVAMEFFVLKRYNFPLVPTISEDINWIDLIKKYIPSYYRPIHRGGNKSKIDDVNDDCHNDCRHDDNKDSYFNRWYGAYRKILFSHLSEREVQNRYPNDAWNVIDVTRVVIQEGCETIADRENVYNLTPISEELNELINRHRESTNKISTDLDIARIIFNNDREAILFRPERLLCHELIIQLTFTYQVDEDSLKTIFTQIRNHQEFIKMKQYFCTLFDTRRQALEDELTKIIEHINDPFYMFHECVCEFQKIFERIKKMQNCSFLGHIPPENLKMILRHTVRDQLLRKYSEEEVKSVIGKLLNNFEGEQKIFKLQKLTLRENIARRSWIIVGGAASGKSSLIRKEIQRAMKAEQWQDICKINPDYYKPLLSPLDRDIFLASKTHAESSIIAKRIMEYLEKLIRNNNGNKCPDTLFDVVKPSEEKLALVSTGEATVILLCTSCPAEIAVYRAFNRGSYGTVNYIPQAFSENIPEYLQDKGRFVPTEVILNGYKALASLLPVVTRRRNVFLHIYNTHKTLGDSHNTIAYIDSFGDEIIIFDVIGFITTIKPQIMQVHTTGNSEDTIYDQRSSESSDTKVKLLMQFVTKNRSLGFKLDNKDEYYAFINLERGLVIVDIDKFMCGFNVSRNGLVEIISVFVHYRHYGEDLPEKIQRTCLNVTIHNGNRGEKVFLAEQGKIKYYDKEWCYTNLPEVESLRIRDNTAIMPQYQEVLSKKRRRAFFDRSESHKAAKTEGSDTFVEEHKAMSPT